METKPSAATKLPRVTIAFCVQCKWNLRAAYFAQELLSTFSTALGEVALQPAEGGIFTITLDTEASVASASPLVIWDRKVQGGFPETKELKRLIRDQIDPTRNLGHIDGKKSTSTTQAQPTPDPLSTQTHLAIANTTPLNPDQLQATPEKEKEPEKEEEILNSRRKIVTGGSSTGESLGSCRPGENCEDCA